MKIKIVIWLAAMCFCMASYGQDILYIKGGKKDTVKVEEVTAKEVVYTKLNNPDGPVYRLPKSEIILIQYANGSIDIMKNSEVSDAEKIAEEKKRKRWEDDPKFVASLRGNLAGINLLNLMNGNLNLFYERINPTGRVGFKITANVALVTAKDDPAIIKYQRKATIGVDLKFYPTGQGKVKYFIGPSIRTGLLGIYNNPYYDGIRKTYFNHPTEFGYFSLMFNNGVVVNPTSHVFISFQAAVGVARFRYLNYKEGTGFEKRFIEADGMIGVNVGYRF
jgi:hypothetical protein